MHLSLISLSTPNGEITSKLPMHIIRINIAENKSREFQKHSMSQRKKSLDDMHTQLKKYLNRMPAVLVITQFGNYFSKTLTLLAIYNPSPSRCAHLSFQSHRIRSVDKDSGESRQCLPTAGAVDSSSCSEVIFQGPCISRHYMPSEDNGMLSNFLWICTGLTG